MSAFKSKPKVRVDHPGGEFVGHVVDRLSRGRLLVRDRVGNEKVVDPTNARTQIDYIRGEPA